MAVTTRKPRRERPPLNDSRLGELALRYVGRFATTRAKLRSYLDRKLRERGWEGEQGPDLDRICERFAAQGYVDDAGYALSKSRSLSARGYGKARLAQALHAAGVGEADAAGARALADAEAVRAALRFAERKRAGPYAQQAADRPAKERLLGAFLRAGHSFALSRAILDLGPGQEPEVEELAELAGKTGA